MRHQLYLFLLVDYCSKKNMITSDKTWSPIVSTKHPKTTIGWSIRNSCTPGWPQLWSIVFPRAPESMTPSRATLTPIPWWVLVWRWSPWSFSWLSGSVVKFQSGTVFSLESWDDLFGTINLSSWYLLGWLNRQCPKGALGCASQYSFTTHIQLFTSHNWLHPYVAQFQQGYEHLWTTCSLG